MNEATARALIAALNRNTESHRKMAEALDSAAGSLNDLAIIIESAVDEPDFDPTSPLLDDFFGPKN